jgi:hypothetical protein
MNVACHCHCRLKHIANVNMSLEATVKAGTSIDLPICLVSLPALLAHLLLFMPATTAALAEVAFLSTNLP